MFYRFFKHCFFLLLPQFLHGSNNSKNVSELFIDKKIEKNALLKSEDFGETFHEMYHDKLFDRTLSLYYIILINIKLHLTILIYLFALCLYD